MRGINLDGVPVPEFMSEADSTALTIEKVTKAMETLIQQTMFSNSAITGFSNALLEMERRDQRARQMRLEMMDAFNYFKRLSAS
jgi:hypothetical protein